jgi:hypothetical protein
VDLHPEELFDQLRAGTLTEQARGRLQAHCAQCSACLFELRWLDTSLAPEVPSAEDRARGEAAFDHVLRAAKQPTDAAPPARSPGPLPLRWGLAGLLLGSGLSVAIFVAHNLWSAQPERAVHASRAVSPALAAWLPAPTPLAAQSVANVPPPSAASVPALHAPRSSSADALLAAARQAQTQSQLHKAARLYRQVIDGYPTTQAASVAGVALGRLLEGKLAQPAAAVSLFDAYLRRHHGGGELAEEALYYRALSFARTGRKLQSEDSLRELLSSYPNSVYTAAARAKLAELLE